MDQDMVIFARTFDLLEWLLPKSERFPRAYRSTVTQRLMDAALDLQEALVAAEPRRGRSRLAALREADAALGRLRIYLRLAHRWRWLSDGQYAHAGGMVAEIGRLLGGWLRAERVLVRPQPRGRTGRRGAEPGRRPSSVCARRPGEPGRADGTRPRHLPFLASVREPWSADNPGSEPGPHREPRSPARRPKAPGLGRSRKMWDEHTTRKPMLLFRLSGSFLLRLAHRALS